MGGITLKGDILESNSLISLFSLLDEKVYQSNGLDCFGLLEGIDEMKTIGLFSAL